MATIEDVEESYKGMQILRLLGWGTKSQMRQFVRFYRSNGDSVHIENAITQPQDRRAQMLKFIEDNGTELVDEYLLTAGNFTMSQLDAFSVDLCNYADGLEIRYKDGEPTSSIADDIEANISDPSERYSRLTFPFPDGYTDKFGR